VHAGEVDEAEEVFNVVFPSSDKAREGVQPGEEAFDMGEISAASRWGAIGGEWALLSGTDGVHAG
jgi:hypothetical protein